MVFWIVIQAIVDIFILVAVLFYIIDRKNRKKEELNEDIRKNELKALIKSLDQLISESEHASINISDKVLDNKKKTDELLEQIDQKQQELNSEAVKAEKVLDKIKTYSTSNLIKNNSPYSDKSKYSEAAKLAKDGLSIEDISKQLDLPKGEIELILDLPVREQTNSPG